MFKVELYGRVRRAVRVEGRSERAVALEFGISRETVRKMLRYAVPPGYQRQQPVKRPKLGPWLGAIDAKSLFAFRGEFQRLLGRPVRPANVARAMHAGEIHPDVLEASGYPRSAWQTAAGLCWSRTARRACAS